MGTSSSSPAPQRSHLTAGPHVGALGAAGNTLGFCLYREFALGQDIGVAACSLRRGLVRITRSLPVPPLAFSACNALADGRQTGAQCSIAAQGSLGPPAYYGALSCTGCICVAPLMHLRGVG